MGAGGGGRVADHFFKLRHISEIVLDLLLECQPNINSKAHLK